MRFFRRATDQGARRVDLAPRTCDYCGQAGEPAGFTEFRTAWDGSTGVACEACEKRYAAFASRLTHASRPGLSPWLEPDPGTAHLVMAGPDPFNGVHAVVEGFRHRVQDVSRATARVVTARLRVRRGGSPVPRDSREEALTTVSGMIAAELGRHHASVEEFMDGREWVVYSVSLFGEGHGVLLSRTSSDGEWLAQYCFLIEFDHSVHPYIAWHA
ncbi:hypothetical protein [Streptomyces sp. SBT349]|uniref:hypothetical protein n=1 Tax=Streptomyces sp. SBT349 TaxID=1580539 RepID=UPI00066E704F|nr:hypothetical protein [Streptomyces sp. SBT349]